MKLSDMRNNDDLHEEHLQATGRDMIETRRHLADLRLMEIGYVKFRNYITTGISSHQNVKKRGQ